MGFVVPGRAYSSGDTHVGGLAGRLLITGSVSSLISLGVAATHVGCPTTAHSSPLVHHLGAETTSTTYKHHLRAGAVSKRYISPIRSKLPVRLQDSPGYAIGLFRHEMKLGTSPQTDWT